MHHAQRASVTLAVFRARRAVSKPRIAETIASTAGGTFIQVRNAVDTLVKVHASDSTKLFIVAILDAADPPVRSGFRENAVAALTLAIRIAALPIAPQVRRLAVGTAKPRSGAITGTRALCCSIDATPAILARVRRAGVDVVLAAVPVEACPPAVTGESAGRVAVDADAGIADTTDTGVDVVLANVALEPGVGAVARDIVHLIDTATTVQARGRRAVVDVTFALRALKACTSAIAGDTAHTVHAATAVEARARRAIVDVVLTTLPVESGACAVASEAIDAVAA